MHNIDPRWDRWSDPTPIESRPDAEGKTVPPAQENGLAKRLDLGELFAGREHRLTEVTDKCSSKVDEYGENECWLWTGPLGPGDFGQLIFRLGGRRKALVAHRFAYALAHPDQGIPDAVQVKHRCGEKLCMNTRHLYLADRRGQPHCLVGNGLIRFEDRLP